MNDDDLFILNKRRSVSESEIMERGRRSDSVLRRFDLTGLEAAKTADAPEEIDRREGVLNARIAQFENLVRKTKFSTAERLEKLAEDEKRRTEKWDELREAIRMLTEKETDLARRESTLNVKLAQIAVKEADLCRNEEEFQARSEQILQKITEQKEELENLISIRLGR